MNIEQDKFLTEAMGECWHEPNNWPYSHSIMTTACCKCGANYPAQFIDFSTWAGFGKLWDWAQNQCWWDAFAVDNIWERRDELIEDIINPEAFASILYNYLHDK